MPVDNTSNSPLDLSTEDAGDSPSDKEDAGDSPVDKEDTVDPPF